MLSPPARPQAQRPGPAPAQSQTETPVRVKTLLARASIWIPSELIANEGAVRWQGCRRVRVPIQRLRRTFILPPSLCCKGTTLFVIVVAIVRDVTKHARPGNASELVRAATA